MPEDMRMWIEVIFNVSYLVVVWGLVAVMLARRSVVKPGQQRLAGLVIAMFGLLALGDTGHVGFRVVAYALGSLEARINLPGGSVGLVGLGSFATAVTVTFFYMLLVEVWRARFEKPHTPWTVLLLAAGVIRLAIMLPSGNQWDSLNAPYTWALARNLPLVIQGLGITYLILRESRRADDRAFTWISICIIISYACYIPVILFVPWAPLIGMLMIPKTLAYLGMAFFMYADLYGTQMETSIQPRTVTNP